MKPTIGRIVDYRLSAADVIAIDQELPAQGAVHRNPVREGQVLPAIVVGSTGGYAANLQVFLDGNCSYWATSRLPGDQPGQWSWPMVAP